MKFDISTRRLAATGAATALAAAGLVAASTSTATAAPEATNSYVCGTSGGLTFPVTLTTNAVGIEGFPEISAFTKVPAGLISVTNHATMPSAAATALGSNHVDHLVVPDFAADFGGNPVGVTGVIGYVSNVVDNGDGTVSLDLPKDDPATQSLEAGLNAAFQVPAAGTYQIVMPSGFTINALAADETLVTAIDCALASGQSPQPLHNITVTKTDSTVKASSNSPVRHGAKAVLKAKVTAPNHKPTGKVTFKDGKKSIGTVKLNKKGVATFTKSLSKGKHTITMIYKGDGNTAGSKAKTVVTQK